MRSIRTRLAVLATILAVALVPGLAGSATATATSRPAEPVIRGTVTLKIGGANVVNIDGKLYAALLPSPRPAKFDVVEAPDGIQFRYQNTGGLVYADPSLEPFSQLSVGRPGEVPPHSTWTVASPPADADEDLEADDLPDRHWVVTIKLAGTDQYIGRHFVENRSLLPKRVLLLPPGVRAPLFVVEPVS
ncbi:I66 family serine proteinase inhibitor [Streptosporangium sp. NPDC002544]|uniref:I66 family serine proteinase inhibitor n=1 Tax=Streptosporangium sp. NPDC002544 TaxID=3154538 RepID=UPI0033199AD9